MYSAKEARERTVTVEESGDLHLTFLAIEEAIARKERFIIRKPFVSDLVWCIINDRGYNIRFGGDKGIIVSW